MMKLKIILASTRPGRAGLGIARWFVASAEKHGKFEVELLDLAEIGLPFLDEPEHPRLQKYEHPHTKDWSSKIGAADAFVVVTPEYNHGAPAPLVNALDYLYREWNYKPVAFVSYGGVSGGTRSVQMTKLIANSLKMVPLVEAVTIPFFQKHVGPDGVFQGDASLEKAATVMLDELGRWADALKALR